MRQALPTWAQLGLRHRTGAGAAGRQVRAARAALVALLAGVILLGVAGPAMAVPPPPPNPTDGQITNARASQDAAAAEVGRLAGLVASAEAELERLTVLAENAGAAYEAAEEALSVAQAAADAAAAKLQEAVDAVAAAQVRVGSFARDSYIDGPEFTTAQALLDAQGPADLIERAALLEFAGQDRIDVVGEMEAARIVQADAEAGARTARDRSAAAEEAAAAAKRTADDQAAAGQAAYQELSAQKATYETQLQNAQIQLLQLQGARNAYQQWQQQKAAEEAAEAAAAARAASDAAAASSGGDGSYVRPASGRTSSCFGSRWGVLHGGVDIAAPIGTPVYAATSGVVQRAGTATGFGYAVYIRGDDGAVTVYGHVNEYYAHAGQRVSAGEQIAEVGNRGQSTGPHLHFEVHPNGAMYSGMIDPVPWMRARGVSITGC